MSRRHSGIQVHVRNIIHNLPATALFKRTLDSVGEPPLCLAQSCALDTVLATPTTYLYVAGGHLGQGHEAARHAHQLRRNLGAHLRGREGGIGSESVGGGVQAASPRASARATARLGYTACCAHGWPMNRGLQAVAAQRRHVQPGQRAHRCRQVGRDAVHLLLHQAQDERLVLLQLQRHGAPVLHLPAGGGGAGAAAGLRAGGKAASRRQAVSSVRLC